MSMNVNLCGIEMDNPIIPASGTFGFGKEFAELYDINILGTFSFKGTTLDPRFGNPTPRIAEFDGGMLNAVGLQNPGVDHVIAQELPEMKEFFHKPVMANVSGFSIEQYVKTCEKLDKEEQVGWLEVNISCPNVTDICAIAKAVEAGGADGVSLINTVMGMRIDLNRKKPIIANKTGGMSGPALLPLAVRMVYQVYEAVEIPIVGMGGVSKAEDVIELMLAGATAVEVGAANLVDPFACKRIIEDLPGVMKKYRIENLKDIIGGAH